MGEFPRKADGRRVFTPEFKRNVVQQIQKGEKTLAELSRELNIYPTVIRTWKRRYEAGASTAMRHSSGSGNSSGCSAESRWRPRSWRRPGTS
jgi:transposase-like protein